MPEHAPQISLIVPSYSRPAAARRCVEALLGQTLGAERYEIVVVDDGSPAPLALPDAWLAPGHLPAVRLIRQPNAGPAAARNRGAEAARGRFLAFTDDDCAPMPRWAAALLAALEEQPDALVGGRTVNALPGNLFSAASQDVVSFLQAHGEASGDPFFASNNLALARAAFQEVGGFDSAYRGAGGEDRAFCRAWAASGRAAVEVPGAVVRHFHALTLRSFWRQHAAYGRGAARFHGTGNGSRAPLAFYARLVGFPLREGFAARPLVRSALLGLAQVATAWGRVQSGGPS
jgi:GT2 family glycosyltransferase